MSTAFRRILAVLLTISLLICPLAMSAEEAADSVVGPTRADNFFQSYSLSLSKNGTTIHASFSTTAKQTAAVLGAPTYDVQRLVNGTWVTVADDLAGSVGTDVISYSFSKNYTAVAGYAYRFKAKYYCQKYTGESKRVTYTSGKITV